MPGSVGAATMKDRLFHRSAAGWLFTVAGLWGCADSGRIADERLSRAIKQTLYDEASVNLLQVQVAVEGRVVYLGGEVDLYPYKERAAELVNRVAGVAAVVNQVLVEP